MNAEDRKHVLRMFDHGLYIAGAGQGEAAIANAITWLTQCSFTPPLIMAAVRKDGRLHDLIIEKGAFAVNVVGKGQQEMVAAFFKPAQVEGSAMNGYRFAAGPATEAPLFTDCPAWFEARVRDIVERGDHTVFVAEIVAAGVRDPQAQALTLRDTPWSYGG
ncbi:MAG: flavin reductase family protein [Chloroflexi bacterium]|nr:flavin reductase family protein [Chloroflexota bacterium]